MKIGIDSFVAAVPDALTGENLGSADRLKLLVDEIEFADRVGLDVFGVGEHHRAEFLERVRHRRDKAIDSDFHRVISALKNALERRPNARNHENPENGDEKSQWQSGWRHEDVKAQYVEDDRPQNRKR